MCLLLLSLRDGKVTFLKVSRLESFSRVVAEAERSELYSSSSHSYFLNYSNDYVK